MKKVRYPNLDDYDLSCYEELKGDILYRINGGAQVENSNEGVANAQVGDTITRNDGTTVTLNAGDIKYAQEQLGDSGGKASETNSIVADTTPMGTTTQAPATTTSNATPSSGNNSTGSNGNVGNNSRNTNSVPEQDHYLKVGLAHVEDYKRTCLATGNTAGIAVKKVTGTRTEAREVAYNGASTQPKNPVSPDNIVTNNPKQAGKNSKKSVNDLIAEYNQKNNTNLPLCAESYNYLRSKGETFGYEDKGGWARLQDTTNANRTMQEGLGKSMKDGSDLGREGCKVMTDTKIESEIMGERIEMDNLNEKATNGLLGLQTVIDDLNERLEQNGDTRRAVGKRYEGKDVNRALLDTISSSEDTIYVTGMADGIVGHTHWLELDRYYTNEYGETQFQYYPSSDFDVSNDRIYLLGSKLFERKEDTVNNNIFSVSVIETITLKNQF